VRAVSTSDPILVTGAAGKTGLAVVAALAGRHRPVRAAIRRPAQRPAVVEAGATEVAVADIEDRGELARVMAGCRAVYYICPNMHPEESRLGREAVVAALEAGVERFVYHSVLHPLTEAMPHHWGKLRVEEALVESELEWTVLQPAPYMQNLLSGWEGIVEEAHYRVPYPVSSRMSLVDLGDVAEAAATVLIGSGHAAATYPLAGTEPLDQEEVAAVLGHEVGRPVRALQTPRGDVESSLRAAGLGAYARETLWAMFDYYGRFGLRGNSNILTWLLGRPPTSLATFVRRNLDE
jgi:uncharacterized protein YbjT (DUF2867 family)